MALESNSDVYKSALELAEAGRHEEALACIQQRLQQNPNDAEALNDAGTILYCQGQLTEAIRHLEKARQLKVDSGEVLWNLVEVYLANGQPAKAMGLFDDMQRLALLNPDLLNRTANEFLAQADKGNAVEVLLRSLRFSSNQEVLEPMIEVIRSQRPKTAFFCGLRADVKFLWDIYEFSKHRYPVKLFEGADAVQMAELMNSSDICWFEWCTDVVVEASRLPKVSKNIVRLHRFEAYESWPKQVQWENIDVLITVGNSFVKKALLRQVPDLESRTRLITIPNGVNLEKFKFVDRQRGKNIACVGYVNMRKNPMFLLQCMQKLHYIDREYKLFLAGNFQDRMLEQYVRHMVEALGLGDVVFFEGWQEDINGWLQDKHYIVSASIGESQGMGLLEGMACGLKPVIHNFPGAEQIFGSQFLFNITEEFCGQILAEAYEPRCYRGFVQERYPLERQLRSINDIFAEFEKELAVSTKPADDFSIPELLPATDGDFTAGADSIGVRSENETPTVPKGDDFTEAGAGLPDFLQSAVQPNVKEGFCEDAGVGQWVSGETGAGHDGKSSGDDVAGAGSDVLERANEKIWSGQFNETKAGQEFGTFNPVGGNCDFNVSSVGNELIPKAMAKAGDDVCQTGAKRKVLVEFNAVIGDVLCMEPAIRALKKGLGEGSQITVRTNHPELFTNHPSISTIEDINSPGGQAQSEGIGDCDYEQKFTLSWVATKEVRGLHLVERAAEQMGVELEDRLPRMYLDDWDYVQLGRFHLPEARGPRIALGPSVRWPSRRWRQDRWRRLCKLMEHRLGGCVVQLGSQGDSFLGCGLDLIGKTSVREAAAVISKCDLLIATDNGLAHIAAAVGTPRVVLYGPVLPEKRMHAGPARAVVSPGHCHGCFHSNDWDDVPPRDCPKGESECMELISVESVLEAVSELLRERTREVPFRDDRSQQAGPQV